MKTIHGGFLLFTIFASLAATTSAFAQTAPLPLPPVPPGVTPVIIPPPIIIQPTFTQAPAPAPAPAVAAPVVLPAPAAPPAPANPNALIWDAESKELSTAAGDVNAPFTFWFTNTTTKEVVINAVRTS